MEGSLQKNKLQQKADNYRDYIQATLLITSKVKRAQLNDIALLFMENLI